MTNDHIDISQPVAEICKRLGLKETYVNRLDIRPGDVTVALLRGKEGRCKGAKYIDENTGDVASEELHFKVLS